MMVLYSQLSENMKTLMTFIHGHTPLLIRKCILSG
jgi:hypothetical protein